MPERLRRLDEAFERVPIYFVTACTHQRRPILAVSEIQRGLISFGERDPGYGAWLGSYVIMPDHLHAFVALDDGRLTLSGWLKSLKNAVSSVLREVSVPPPHWQKGFLITSCAMKSLTARNGKYVRENPVRARLVSHWEEWPYVGAIFDLEFRRDRI